ncbi:hypothetical protein ACFPM0_11575 [Pseudonocardia sulfidoxydans]
MGAEAFAGPAHGAGDGRDLRALARVNGLREAACRAGRAAAPTPARGRAR